MTAKQSATKLAQTMGISLEVGGGRYFEVTADAPAGMVFSSSGLHCIVASTNGESDSRQVWQTILEQMRVGVSRCVKPDCDFCSPSA